LAHAERFVLKNPKGPVAGHTIQMLKFGADAYVVVETPKTNSLLATLSLNSEAASEELRVTIPNDGLRGAVGGEKAWHPDAMKYDQLPVTRDGHDVIVAVIDTGVDYNHPALKDHIFANPKEIPANGIDDDKNGFVDDVHGYDFDSKKGDPMDGDRHGTHCAGVIGATKDPATNAQGVAPGVKIMAVRIIGADQKGFLSNAAAGIKYAVDNGAKVLSNSWRVYRSWNNFDPSDANVALLRAAIDYANQHGVIFVAASGNESIDMDSSSITNDPMFPGGFDGLPTLLVVAASDQSGAMASFSNYGATHVSVAAPGDEILSTGPGGQWATMSGTSMAAPLIAGSIARGLSGGLPMNEAINRLITTSSQSSAWTSKVKGGGVVDLVKYLTK
jgi:subtilisin family serine protease